jgi:hypothetical protein
MFSVNNKVMVEPYKGTKQIRSKTSSGFSSIEQKSTLTSLKVLAEAHVCDTYGNEITIPEGASIVLKEEFLATQSSVLKHYKINENSVEYMLVEFSEVVAIQ